MEALLIAADTIDQLEHEVTQLKVILRDACSVIERTVPTDRPGVIPDRRRTLEAIDKAL
jgi:hypothetical protein